MNLALTLVIWRCTEAAIVTCLEPKWQQFLELSAEPLAAELPPLHRVLRAAAAADIWIAGVRSAVGLAATALFGQADPFLSFLRKVEE